MMICKSAFSSRDIVSLDAGRRVTEKMLWSKAAPLVPTAYEAQVREKIKSGMGIGRLFGCRAQPRK